MTWQPMLTAPRNALVVLLLSDDTTMFTALDWDHDHQSYWQVPRYDNKGRHVGYADVFAKAWRSVGKEDV